MTEERHRNEFFFLCSSVSSVVVHSRRGGVGPGSRTGAFGSCCGVLGGSFTGGGGSPSGGTGISGSAGSRRNFIHRLDASREVQVRDLHPTVTEARPAPAGDASSAAGRPALSSGTRRHRPARRSGARSGLRCERRK